MAAGITTVVSALADALAVDPGRPLITFYDGATGERIELSVGTVDNWVSKIANLFGDELVLEPGDSVRVDLPTHWQSAVTLLGAWTAGLRVLHDPASEATVSVVGPAARVDADSVTGQPIACSMRPLGAPFVDGLPDGWLDFALAVPGQPDVVLSPARPGPADAAVEAAGRDVSHAELVDSARRTASEIGMSASGRLLTDANPSTARGLGIGLVAPLVTGCSIVLVTNCDGAAVAAIARQERATVSALGSPAG